MPLTGPEKNKNNVSATLTPEAKDYLRRYAAISEHDEGKVVRLVLQAWYKGADTIEDNEKITRAKVENQIALGMPPPEKVGKRGKMDVPGIVGGIANQGAKTQTPSKPGKPRGRKG